MLILRYTFMNETFYQGICQSDTLEYPEIRLLIPDYALHAQVLQLRILIIYDDTVIVPNYLISLPPVPLLHVHECELYHQVALVVVAELSVRQRLREDLKRVLRVRHKLLRQVLRDALTPR